MLRFMVGFVAGLVFGLNCPKFARKGSKLLRELADRLDRLVEEKKRFELEEERLHVVR